MKMPKYLYTHDIYMSIIEPAYKLLSIDRSLHPLHNTCCPYVDSIHLGYKLGRSVSLEIYLSTGSLTFNIC